MTRTDVGAIRRSQSSARCFPIRDDERADERSGGGDADDGQDFAIDDRDAQLVKLLCAVNVYPTFDHVPHPWLLNATSPLPMVTKA
jgi:hypothetical protein